MIKNFTHKVSAIISLLFILFMGYLETSTEVMVIVGVGLLVYISVFISIMEEESWLGENSELDV